MARSLRYEFSGGVYHIISRGNYRKNLFSKGGAGKAFEKALYEASERCGWVLHAYVIMSNHYHLALETPEPNLVDGMKWLQGTFANRFNRFRGERGHVFQGRYKSLIVEPGEHLLSLVDYIHLNPVRSGICTIDGLQAYELSSYSKYFQRSRNACLDRGLFLQEAGFPNTLSGMRRYAKLLELKEEADPRRRKELDKKYCRGWLLGEAKYKKDILKEIRKLPKRESWSGSDIQAMKEAEWEDELKGQLKKRRKHAADGLKDAKSAKWKVDIARHLRKTTTASNSWIAEKLNMGHPSRVSNLIHGN